MMNNIKTQLNVFGNELRRLERYIIYRIISEIAGVMGKTPNLKHADKAVNILHSIVDDFATTFGKNSNTMLGWAVGGTGLLGLMGSFHMESPLNTIWMIGGMSFFLCGWLFVEFGWERNEYPFHLKYFISPVIFYFLISVLRVLGTLGTI